MYIISIENGEVYIAIYDNDKEYICRFSQYMNQRPTDSIHILFFTDEKLFVDCITDNKDILVLISESALEQSKMTYSIENTIVLCEQSDVVSINSMDTIYKYQAIESVISKLLNFFLHKICTNHNKAVIKKGESLIIGIYSPVNRCGKTMFSLQLGQKLADKYKVLLLNFDEFSPLLNIMGKECYEDLADVMYYFMQDQIGFDLMEKSVIQKYHGMDFIPPMKYSTDIRKIEVTLWKKFILETINVQNYDIVLLDISSNFANVETILEMCDLILMPYCSDKISLFKVNEFEKYLLLVDKMDIYDRIHTFEVQSGYINIQDLENYIIHVLYEKDFLGIIETKMKV